MKQHTLIEHLTMSARAINNLKHIPDLVAMDTGMRLPICKHKSVNTYTENVAIDTHQHMWNDSKDTALDRDLITHFTSKKKIMCVARERKRTVNKPNISKSLCPFVVKVAEAC